MTTYETAAGIIGRSTAGSGAGTADAGPAAARGLPAGEGTVLRIGGIEPESVVDGPGFRYVVFVQGCNLRCPGCHNRRLQNFEGGRPAMAGDLLGEIRENPLLDGITLSGGDPFTQAEACAVLAEEVRALGLSVMTFTGYLWEDLCAAAGFGDGAAGFDNGFTGAGWRRLIEATDILVDGPFIQALRNIDLRFRGSSNQRLIDVRKSLIEGRTVTLPEVLSADFRIGQQALNMF